MHVSSREVNYNQSDIYNIHYNFCNLNGSNSVMPFLFFLERCLTFGNNFNKLLLFVYFMCIIYIQILHNFSHIVVNTKNR